MQEKINRAANQNNVEHPAARNALDTLKYEIARELGITVPKVGDAYDWRLVPSFYCGIIGGEIVKRSMQMVEKSLAEEPQVIAKVLSSVEPTDPRLTLGGTPDHQFNPQFNQTQH